MEEIKVDSITGEVIVIDPNKEQRALTIKNINNEIFSDEVLDMYYQLQVIEERKKEIQHKLLPYMRAYCDATGEKSIGDEYKTITYVKGYLRTDFDAKKFAEDHPELFKQYQKLTAVKESVKVKII